MPRTRSHRLAPLAFVFVLATTTVSASLCQPGPAAVAAAAKERLPQAPDGVRVRVVARFTPQDQEPLRSAAHPTTGKLYVPDCPGPTPPLAPKSVQPPRA